MPRHGSITKPIFLPKNAEICRASTETEPVAPLNSHLTSLMVAKSAKLRAGPISCYQRSSTPLLLHITSNSHDISSNNPSTMANNPFISIRKYIKWGDDPAGENTDTLVLTSAAKSFVDVRIFLPTSTTPFTNTIESLEWGFAGTAESTLAQEERPAHTEWSHWVDSKTTEEVRDEGDMYPQENGEVLEYGSMVNPAKGVMEKYEECWVDLSPRVIPPEKGFVSWVLKCEDVERGVKGKVIRIGEYIQGVLRKGDGISVGRWMWSEGDGWRKAVDIGGLGTEVPSEVLRIDPDVKEGDKKKGGGGLEWKCIEAFSWG
jgi:hypothetical protein